jgi:ubiquitin carboxyl-terminal hydrolase 2/21
VLLRKRKTLDNVEDCLKAFTGEERLEGDEAFFCPKCKTRTTATKTLRIHRFPRCLVLHIKRFKLQSKQHVKMINSVAFPLTDLNLAAFASEGCAIPPETARYDLYAVSNHTGTLTSGHYTAVCKLQNLSGSQTWYSFDDDTVTPVPPEKINSAHAYMMFYVLRGSEAGRDLEDGTVTALPDRSASERMT